MGSDTPSPVECSDTNGLIKCGGDPSVLRRRCSHLSAPKMRNWWPSRSSIFRLQKKTMKTCFPDFPSISIISSPLSPQHPHPPIFEQGTLALQHVGRGGFDDQGFPTGSHRVEGSGIDSALQHLTSRLTAWKLQGIGNLVDLQKPTMLM